MDIKNKKLIINLALLIITVTLFFIIFEIILRIILGPGNIQDNKGNLIFVQDDKLGHKMKPNFTGYLKGIDFNTKINTNSQGYRSFEFNVNDKNIIFMVGDSMVLGHGVEENETASFLLQDNLNNSHIVYNLGVPGYGQKQAPIQLKRMLPLYKPELVILNFYVGNDLADNCEITPHKIAGTIDENKTAFEKIKSIIKKSQVVLFLYKSIIVPQKNPTDLPFHINDPSIEECYNITKQYLSEIKNLTLGYKTKLFMVIIGSEPQTVKEKEKALIKNYEKFDIYRDNKEKFNLYNINKKILNMCEELSIKCFDLTPIFKEKDGELILYVKDRHWNREGHKLASQAITEYLKNLEQ